MPTTPQDEVNGDEGEISEQGSPVNYNNIDVQTTDYLPDQQQPSIPQADEEEQETLVNDSTIDPELLVHST